MRGTTAALIQTTAGGVSAMTGRHIAQDTSAASANTAATTMAAGAGTVMEMEIGMATVIAESTGAAMEATGYGANAAQQYGYQDGINDGSRDRRSGHSNRPTQDSNYKHADHGYSSSYGNKNYYKQEYRQAYENGYQQGYNSGGGWRRY